jgi:type I restriction enzyme M protein
MATSGSDRPINLTGDAFGKVYEYFPGNFAMKEGQKGGVWLNDGSCVRLRPEHSCLVL